MPTHARYLRQTALPQVGERGQSALGSARVLVVGVGGLGCVAASYLVGGGVGTVGLVDDDAVAVSNLHRQIIYATPDLGRRKVYAAADRLRAANPDVRVVTHPTRFAGHGADRLLSDYDFLIDGTDSFEAKLFIAKVCHRCGVPYSHAGILEFFGQTLTVIPGRTACYRCVFADPPPTPADGARPRGPLGPVPGVIGAIQATEAMKHVLGLGRLLTDRLLTYDALEMRFRSIRVHRNKTCRLCGETAARLGGQAPENGD